MAASAHVYTKGIKRMAAGDIDWDAHTIKFALLGTGYTPSQSTHESFSDVSAQEVSGTNYTGGGQALTSKTNTTSGTTQTLDSDDPAWASSTITGARYGVLYDATSGYLILYVDFGASYSSSNSTFTYPVPSAGWATQTAA